jgi:hypothetical protein
LLTGCVGPGQHVRGGHYGGHHRHSSGADGLLAVLEGVALIADIAADVSEAQAATESQRRVVAAAPPPHPEPVRPLPAWFQGRLRLPTARPTLPEIRIGVQPMSGGPLVAILDSDSLGRFSFAVPPAGSYRLVVLDPEYQGEMVFTSDGRKAFPLEFPISPSQQHSNAMIRDSPAQSSGRLMAPPLSSD